MMEYTSKGNPQLAGNYRFALLTAAMLVVVFALGTIVVVQRVLSIAGERRDAAYVAEVEALDRSAREALPAGNLRIGERLPDFTIQDAEGNDVEVSSFIDGEHYVVVNFHHPGCPCAENCGRLVSHMQQQGYDRDVRVIGVMAHDTRSERALEQLEEQKAEGRVTFPVYFDHDRSVKRLLGASRTPEVWVLDKDGTIAYYGAPESTLFPGSEGHRFLLREAIDALRAGEAPEVVRYDPIGCLIPEEG